MTDDGQALDPLEDPPGELLVVARRVTPAWLARSIERALAQGGVTAASTDRSDIDELVERTTDGILAELAELLATDVDDQRTNPLAVYRSGLGAVTAYLRGRHVPTPPADRFAADRYPDDPYQLGPATWSDIDDELHTPGLIWGAWKAKTVLDRRRAEGLR